jgi:hypothetical protein
MIEEAHSADFTSLRLPFVAPWTAFPVCLKCGHQLGAGMRLVRWFYLAKGASAHRIAWCRGDQNSTVGVTEMRFGSEGAQMSVEQVNVLCFGVIEEHLHVVCGRCSYSWLMAVKEGTK